MPPVGPRRLLLPPTETEWRRGRAGEVVEVACGRQGMDRAVEGNRMSAEERLREIGEILAAGLLRLRAKQARPESSTAERLSLDFPAHQSVHGRKAKGRERP